MIGRVIARIPYCRPIHAVAKTYYLAHTSSGGHCLNTNGERSVLRLLAKHSRTVIDGGANIGDWTRALLQYNGNIQVHCFEPAGDSFVTLRNRLSLANVFCNKAALWDKTETAQLNLWGANSERNSLFEMPGVQDCPERLEHEEVACVRVDDYLKQRGVDTVDLMKLDCEGSEVKALLGARMSLESGRIKAVQFEYNYTWLPGRFQLKDAFDLLIPLGFALYRILPRRLERKTQYSVSDEDYKLVNYIAVRDEYKDILLCG
jgi:FkbM family methyltransferase